MSKHFCRCRCHLWSNFFLANINCHVTYFGRRAFIDQYYQVLNEKGLTQEDIQSCVNKLEQEQQRRKQLMKDSYQRKCTIRDSYQPLPSEIFHLKENYLSKHFLEVISHAKTREASRDSVSRLLSPRPDKNLYTFPVFTEEFCNRFLEEMEHFQKSDLPKGRPNTMNRYGISLDELGFYEHFITPLRENYLNPLCKLLYPEWTCDGLDSHKAFVVVYKMGEDVDLSTHYDNAEVTLNISLGKDFEEGSLYIGRMRDEPRSDTDFVEVPHTRTHGLLHRGQQLHGAMPIEDGERYNLIIWMRSSSRRNQRCPMCDQEPVLEEVDEGFGDGFTRTEVNVCDMLQQLY